MKSSIFAGAIMPRWHKSGSLLDPWIFEQGSSEQKKELETLYHGQGQKVMVQDALCAYFAQYVEEPTPDHERLFYVGELCADLKIEEAPGWIAQWHRSLPDSQYVKAGRLFIAFLSGFFGPEADCNLTSMQTTLDEIERQNEGAKIDGDWVIHPVSDQSRIALVRQSLLLSTGTIG
jgi:hypothetical protein